MRLQIKNIGKIRSADIDLRGITVIVGDNNTGKTTVGRALYTFFTSLRNIDNEVMGQRKKQIRRILQYFYDIHRRPFRRTGESLDNLVSLFLESNDDEGASIHDFLSQTFYGRADRVEIDEVVNKIRGVKLLTNKQIRHQIIENYFNFIFHEQCITERSGIEEATISATVSGRDIIVDITKGEYSYKSDVSIQNRAFFIDTPDILNYWSMGSYGSLIGSQLNRTIRDCISQAVEKIRDPADHAFDSILFSKKYSYFVAEISKILKGSFKFDNSGFLWFEEHYNSGSKSMPFELSNVSQGSKAFGILEIMLNYEVFEDGDVLILDEPEIHLHPAWQLEYARIIVALQKAFNLTVLVTTHSSNFLLAMQFYARILGQKDCITSYRVRNTEETDGLSIIDSQDPSDWDSAYASFINAANQLANLHEKAFNSADTDRNDHE